MREASGLAMSSRNLRLSPDGQERAAKLYPIMQQVAARLAGGESFAPLADEARCKLTAAGFNDTEYFDLRCEEQLQLLDRPTRRARLLVATWMDGIRLIDNIAIDVLKN